jgi:hypothetical protein
LSAWWFRLPPLGIATSAQAVGWLVGWFRGTARLQVPKPPHDGTVLKKSMLHNNCFTAEEWALIDHNIDWDLEGRFGLTKDMCMRCKS